MDSRNFVANLLRETDQLLSRLSPRQTLVAEAGGDLSPRNLLRIALKNELEAAEIAALWIESTAGAPLKLALARQAGDEAKHYGLIEERLRALGDNLSDYDPLAAGHSPLFAYLRTLATDVERVAAGQFTREAIALVKNAQFIELCEHVGDRDTARLYREAIQPDERFHHELGVRFLSELASNERAQRIAAAARLRTIELADEMQSAAYARAKIHHAPGC